MITPTKGVRPERSLLYIGGQKQQTTDRQHDRSQHPPDGSSNDLRHDPSTSLFDQLGLSSPIADSVGGLSRVSPIEPSEPATPASPSASTARYPLLPISQVPPASGPGRARLHTFGAGLDANRSGGLVLDLTLDAILKDSRRLAGGGPTEGAPA